MFDRHMGPGMCNSCELVHYAMFPVLSAYHSPFIGSYNNISMHSLLAGPQSRMVAVWYCQFMYISGQVNIPL